jgi:aryl-alcohol dehydrogenase-like predicted oxidoreductase
METVQLGGSSLQISRLGLGTWSFGGEGWLSSWGARSDDASVAVLRHAIDRGINWIDTAPGYGVGHAEELVGRALSQMDERERPLVFTKCGVVWNPDDKMAFPRLIASPAVIRREIEESLRRLRLDHVDLYQVHWPSKDGTPYEETWATMLDLQRQGKTRAIGVSNYGVDALEATISAGRLDSVQLPLSLIRREAAAEIVPWCAQRGVGVLAYSPLQSGLLSGAMTTERLERLERGDWRRSDPSFTGEEGTRNLALARQVGAVARRLGASVPAVAIAWIRAFPAVTGVVLGARAPAQVDEWLAGSELVLGADDLDELAEAIRSTGAGAGPLGP